MKIVEQQAVLLWHTPCAETVIEETGRIAYQSESHDESAEFVKMLISRGHESVLEHVLACFILTTDRGISHELVRHRLASYTQESTRYCKYNDEITVIQPPGLSETQYNNWIDSIDIAEQNYIKMLNNGCMPQIARSVLPTCLKTQIAITANFREWRHILKLRLAKNAHPQMQELMKLVRDKLIVLSPSCFMEFKS